MTRADARIWLRLALVVVGTFGIIRSLRFGFNVGTDRLPLAVDLISEVVPTEVWGVMWLLSGILAWASIPKCWPAGSIPVVGMCLVWAVAYTGSWIYGLTSLPHGDPARGDYLGASTYWTVALLLICGYFLARRAVDGQPEPRVA